MGLETWVGGQAGDVEIVMWLLGTLYGVFFFGDGLCRDNKCLNLLEHEMDRRKTKKIYGSSKFGWAPDVATTRRRVRVQEM